MEPHTIQIKTTRRRPMANLPRKLLCPTQNVKLSRRSLSLPGIRIKISVENKTFHFKQLPQHHSTMSLTVKSISVIYSPINQDNTFTNGDFISGQVILDVAKETQMQSLSIKIKGKADVRWSEHHGKTTVVYSDKEKFYSMERFFVREDKSHGNNHELLKAPSGQAYSSVVAPGSHVYPFVFQLPQQNYPPSFKGSAGKIVYTLMTKLCRSLRISSKAVSEFHYVPKPDLQNPELLAPQYGTIDKQMKLFTSGSVAMNLKTEKTGYYLDEGLKVLGEIQNNSSRAIKPKYYMYEKHSFFARSKRRLHTNEILKEEGEAIEQKTNKNVTKVLRIPPSLSASILNCRIIKVEYRLRVCLDVPYASDPEIKFPVILLPPQTTSGAKCPSNSDFGIWNQHAGGIAYPNAPPMAPGQFGTTGSYGPSPGQFGATGNYGPSPGQFGSSGNYGPSPGQFGASENYGPSPGQFGSSGNYGLSPGQFGTPGNSGPSGQYAAPGYVGPPSQFAPPGYPGPPAQLPPPVSNFQQYDPSDLPPYQDYQLHPQIPDVTKKS